MKVTLEQEDIDAIADAVAQRIGSLKTADEEDDFVGDGTKEEKKKELTLAEVQDAIGEAIKVHGKDKLKACVKKVSGADKVSAIPPEKFQAVIDAIAKIK